MAGYDLQGARQAGVPDADIAAALAPKLNYDLEGARKAGVPDSDIVEALASKFNSTPGGAAVGNPNIEKQGRLGIRSGPFDTKGLATIGEAGVLGGAFGAMSKEILTGAGNVIGSFPQPAARTIGGFLKGAGQVIGTGGRAAPAAAGVVMGAGGETAGQTAEMMGAGPVTAEVARFVGGGLSPSLVNAGIQAMKWVISMPTMASPEVKISKEVAKQLLAHLEKEPASLTDIERKYLDDQIAAIRGPAGKTNEPLEKVGSIMGDEGKRLMDEADSRMIVAQAKAAGAKLPPGAEMADVGGDLQKTINTRFKGALEARSAAYTANEKARDAIVSQRETAGSFVNSLPEYQAVVNELRAQLANEEVMKRSPSVQASYQKILNDLTNPETTEPTKKMVQSGLNLDLVEVPGANKPISFQALDDVRRKLGDAFRGKPAEGYDAIGEKAAKDLYGKVSNIQEQFAGGKGGPQRKLLDDYAAKTEGLEKFSSKYGKKSTALDQYREDTFATDPSTLPGAYFKTRASVQALKELTGNQAQVNHAALEFANKELAGKDAAGVRTWLSKNSEWLSETGPTRTLIDRYATKLEGVERSMANVTDFAKQAAKDSSMLTRQSLPAQRAVDLIKSGDTELWSKITPAIMQSPQAKTQMVQAVKQVVADQATGKGTIDLFSRNIRPFIEGSGIGTKAEMDFIAQKLAAIQEMKVPEAEKLSIAKRIILQAAGGWAATAAARTGVATYGWTKEKMVPE